MEFSLEFFSTKDSEGAMGLDRQSLASIKALSLSSLDRKTDYLEVFFNIKF
jgi:hypothetical protein